MEHSDKYRRLARATWRKTYGPIPKKHHIHHIDGDVKNWSLSNLECMPGHEHLSMHLKERVWDRVCTQCGNAFRREGTIKGGRFCSNACRSAHRRASGVDDVARVCPKCKRVFLVNRYSTQKFCALVCADPGSYERKVSLYDCLWCGSKFEAKNRRAMYCSEACRKRYYRRIVRRE